MKTMNSKLMAAGVVLLLLIVTAGAVNAQGVLFVKNGKVGIGDPDPQRPLVVRSTDDAPGNDQMIRLINNGAPFMFYEDTASGETWALQPTTPGTTFTITNLNVPGGQLLLTKTGNLTIQGTITTSGSCSGGCDGLFGPEYEIESIDDHADYMWQNSHLPGVGPTAEGGTMNLSQKTAGILNELEKAHVYIEQLHDRLANLEAKLAAD